MEFPRFNGKSPREWFRRCHRNFMLNPMSDVEKILLASMHPEGKAEYWYMDTIEGKEYMEWVLSHACLWRDLWSQKEKI